MVTKKALIDWLQADSVEVVSADLDAVPIGEAGGFVKFGQVITIIVTNAEPGHSLEGVNIVSNEEPTEEQLKAKAAEAKRVQEGWE